MAAGDYTPTTTTMDLSGDAPAMAAHVARADQEDLRAVQGPCGGRKPGRKLLSEEYPMSDKAFKYSAVNPATGWMFLRIRRSGSRRQSVGCLLRHQRTAHRSFRR